MNNFFDFLLFDYEYWVFSKIYAIGKTILTEIILPFLKILFLRVILPFLKIASKFLFKYFKILFLKTKHLIINSIISLKATHSFLKIKIKEKEEQEFLQIKKIINKINRDILKQFQNNLFPNDFQMALLSKTTGLSKKQVQVYFRNQRYNKIYKTKKEKL